MVYTMYMSLLMKILMSTKTIKGFLNGYTEKKKIERKGKAKKKNKKKELTNTFDVDNNMCYPIEKIKLLYLQFKLSEMSKH